MVVKADWAGGGKITANPAAKLTYDSPAVSTYSPSAGWSEPAGPVASYSNMPAAGTQAQWSAPTNSWTAPAQQSPVPQAPAPVAEPPAPPAPPVGGRQWYNALDAGAQAQTQDQWLGGDSDYTAQLGEYDRALNDFIARIVAQKEGFDTDANNAVAANTKNMQFSGDQLGEDFGARGMSYSGLFDKSLNTMNTRFKDQESNINQVRTKNKSEADNRQADYTAENNIGRGNAKRSALTRMAAQQAMLDSGAGF